MLDTPSRYSFRVFWVWLYTYLYWCIVYFHVFLLLISIFLFQHKELVSEFFCKKVTEFWTLSAFPCLEKPLFSFHFWRTTFLGKVFSVAVFLFQGFHSALATRFLLGNLHVALAVDKLLCVRKFHFSAFNILSLVLIFDSSVIMYLEEYHFGWNFEVIYLA